MEWTSEQIAAKRGSQTLRDGLIAAAIVAVGTIAISVLNEADGWRWLVAHWESWTFDIFKYGMVAVVTAVVSWWQRRYVDPADDYVPARADDSQEG